MKCTLKDLAAKCKMDLSTVSRALRDDPRVKPDTVKKIKKLAASMGYRPNLAARSLAAGRTGTIMFLLGSLNNPIEKDPAIAASKKLIDLDYDMLIALHRGERKIYKRLLDRLRQGAADGAVIIPAMCDASESFDILRRTGFPFVFLDRYLPDVQAPVIGTDNYACVRSLIEKALTEGVESFVVIGAEHNPVARARRESALKILGELKKDFVCVNEFAIEPSKEAMKLKGDICILATGQHAVLPFMRENEGLLRPDRRMIFAVFDLWMGEPNPAEKVFVCLQDFEKMAEKSIDVLFEIINGTRNMTQEFFLFPAKDIIVHEKKFS